MIVRRGRRLLVDSQAVDGTDCAYEFVIDGVDHSAVAAAMRAAIEDAAGDCSRSGAGS